MAPEQTGDRGIRYWLTQTKPREVILLAVAVLLWGVALVMIEDAADGTGGAAQWFPAVAISAPAAALCLVGIRTSGGALAKWCNLAVALVAAIWASLLSLSHALDGDSAVIWCSTAVLFTVLGIVAALGAWFVETDRPKRAPSPISSWDPRVLFGKLDHWQTPKVDHAPGAAREMAEFEALALARADLQRRRFRKWQLAQYGLGLPAALLAAIGGANGLADLSRNWTVTLGLLGLLGAGLTSMSTALNAGRKAEEAIGLIPQYESIAYDAHVLRETSRVEPIDVVKIVERLNAVSASVVAGLPPQGAGGGGNGDNTQN